MDKVSYGLMFSYSQTEETIVERLMGICVISASMEKFGLAILNKNVQPRTINLLKIVLKKLS